MNNNSIFSRITNLSKSVKLLLLATLITNIGNGMHTIAFSKLVYDKTNSAMAFGGVIILQYIVMFSLQFVSGSLVDRNNPKYVSIICDLVRGLLVFSSGLMVLLIDVGLLYLYVAVLIINIVTPFFTSASFALLPTIVKEKDELLKVNAISTTLFQGGQLLGSALAAPIIFLFNPSTALIVDGMTFFVSALVVCFVKITDYEYKKDAEKNIGKNLFNDWKEIVTVMKKEKSFRAHLFLTSGDYISINFFNVMLVPMVIHWYNNNSFYISLFDGGFAIGAMVFVAFVVAISKKIGVNNSAFVGLLVEAIAFALICISRNPITTFAIMLIIGAANSFSVTIFNSNLQQRSKGAIKGRVGSAKNLIVSCLTIILIPIISHLHDISIVYGLMASSGIIFIYAALSFALGRKAFLGDDYLTKTIEINEHS